MNVDQTDERRIDDALPGLDYGSISIVVIDDDKGVLECLTDMLEFFGFSVSAFNDPIRALDWIKNNRADVVISDILMPDYDGFYVLDQLKSAKTSADLILITARAQVPTTVRAFRGGVADFLVKPIGPEELLAAVKRTQRFRMITREKEVLAGSVPLPSQISPKKGHLLVGQSDVMKDVAGAVLDVANLPMTVLILGETGTGKELVARAIHGSGVRRVKPFITVDCGSIPPDVFDAELFGQLGGGATEERRGFVEAAEGGTLFFDEIGDLPLKCQPKLLRLLEQKAYTPVGDTVERYADIRVLAATNHSMEDLTRQGRFRGDLYYRLSAFVIRLPPLRDRRSDIPLLATYFMIRLADEMGKTIDTIDSQVLDLLLAHDFPGNVRELRNIVETAVVRCDSDALGMADLPDGFPVPAPPPKSRPSNFADLERQLYRDALALVDGDIAEAATGLGMAANKLSQRISALGIRVSGQGSSTPTR